MLVRGAVSNVGTAAHVQPYIDVAMARAAALQYHHHLFSYVGTAAEDAVALVSQEAASTDDYLTASDAGDLADIMYGDACRVLAARGAVPSRATCAAFRGGVLTKGVNIAMANFLALNRGGLTRRQAATVTAASGLGTITNGNVTSPYSLVTELNGRDMEDAFTFADAYLLPACRIMAHMFTSQVQAAVIHVRAFLIAFLVAFLLVFAAYQFGVYQPQVHRTNSDIKAERFVMLLLPARLLTAVPDLTDLLESMLAADDKAAAATAVVA